MDTHAGHNFHLDVAPTEMMRSFDEKNSFTVRLPLNQLLKHSEEFLHSLIDTANVAFSCNDKSHKQIYITVPPKTEHHLTNLIILLEQSGFQVKILSGKPDDFVTFNMIKHIEWTCVDRRLDDKGCDAASEIGQITHPGAIAFLHPKIVKAISAHHGKHLNYIAMQIKEHRWKIQDIVLHAGIDGASGCGGIGIANKGGAEIRTIADHLKIVQEIRDMYHPIMNTKSRIMAQLVDPNNNVTTIDTDDAGQRRELLHTNGIII
jgi:hypothetical protein